MRTAPTAAAALRCGGRVAVLCDYYTLPLAWPYRCSSAPGICFALRAITNQDLTARCGRGAGRRRGAGHPAAARRRRGAAAPRRVRARARRWRTMAEPKWHVSKANELDCGGTGTPWNLNACHAAALYAIIPRPLAASSLPRSRARPLPQGGAKLATVGRVRVRTRTEIRSVLVVLTVRPEQASVVR